MPSSNSSSALDPASRDKYLLRVTAGPSYSPSTHTIVPVNSSCTHLIENDLVTCHLKVKIRDYNGLPQNSPSTSPYFSHPMHIDDRYSIAFSFVPKRDIHGEDLVMGFDFDHPVRDRLPPGFKYAMKIVTTVLDPGIYSDPYSDKPYLYGPALSSFFALKIGERTEDVSVEDQLTEFEKDEGVLEEDTSLGSNSIPQKSAKRRKHFLNASNLQGFTFEAGRMYQADFYNPYLDFANFALRIPHFSISIAKYIDEKTHQLRYVLKNRRTDECLFVVVFTLLFGENLEDALQPEATGGVKEEEENGTETKTVQSLPVETENHQMPSRGRLQTPSSAAARTRLSSRSPSTVPSDPDVSETGDQQNMATTWAKSIYSGLAALGFGRSASVSSSDAGSTSTSPERPRKTLNERIDELDETKMETYLKSRHSNVS